MESISDFIVSFILSICIPYTSMCLGSDSIPMYGDHVDKWYAGYALS